MEKKQSKHTSGDIKKEVLQIIALSILCEINSSIRKSGWFTILADQCTDVSVALMLICDTRKIS